MHWIDEESGFPKVPHYITLFFHGDGANVLGHDQVERIFEALDTIRTMEGYNDVCRDSKYTDAQGLTTCAIIGAPRFWNSSATSFQENSPTDEETIAFLSRREYADGTPVVHRSIYGYPTYEDEDKTSLASVISYSVAMLLPDSDDSDNWALDAVDLILKLDQQWAADTSLAFRVETEAYLSVEEELERSIIKDMPLIPLVFIIMSVFTAVIFASKDKVYSRSLLGFSAVVGVLLSLMSGFGLMFLCGVPFTSMTQIVL